MKLIKEMLKKGRFCDISHGRSELPAAPPPMRTHFYQNKHVNHHKSSIKNHKICWNQQIFGKFWCKKCIIPVFQLERLPCLKIRTLRNDLGTWRQEKPPVESEHNIDTFLIRALHHRGYLDLDFDFDFDDGCAIWNSKPIPIFRGHFDRKRCPFWGFLSKWRPIFQIFRCHSNIKNILDIL